MEHIKSPLNYTGNKYRILSQIQPNFPKKIKVMVDLFCGGATVGLNTDCEKIIFIDNDKNVIGLLKFLAKSKYETFVKDKVTDIARLLNSRGIKNRDYEMNYNSVFRILTNRKYIGEYKNLET